MRRSFAVITCVAVFVLLVGQPMLSIESRNAAFYPIMYNTPLSNQIEEGDNWWNVTSMDSNRNGIFDYLEEMITARDSLDIFVDYEKTPSLEDVDRLKGIGIDTTGVFDQGRAIGANDVDPAKLPLILRLPGVVMIEPKMNAEVLVDNSVPNAKARPSAEYSPYTAWELGYSGKGVNIAIVDSGIDDSHPGLVGKFVAGVEFSHPFADVLIRGEDGSFNPDDTNGHGTTCAGISTGTGAPEGVYMGAAPGARLVDVRIGTAAGFAPGELIDPGEPRTIILDGDATLAGIEWVGDHWKDDWPAAPAENDGIDILSLSWGISLHDVQHGGEYKSDGSDVYSRTIDALMAQGVYIVNAAGNEGDDNVGLRGCAAASTTIVVAASDEKDTITRDDDEVADYSSRGPRFDNNDGNPYNELSPRVSSAGTSIVTTQYSRIGDATGNGYENKGSGTSYSTPLVAGVVAMMIEANDNMTPFLAREILQATAERKGEPERPDLDPFWNGDWGWGLVDAYSAVRLSEMTRDTRDLNTNIQCYIMNTTEGDDTMVSGMAWNREGEVSAVQYRIGGGSWKNAAADGENGSWDSWHFMLSSGSIPTGNQTIEVRAVENDYHSLTDWIVVEGADVADDDRSIGGGTGSFVGVAAIAVVMYGMWRALKDRNKKEPVPAEEPPGEPLIDGAG